jgi:hypothetical protein
MMREIKFRGKIEGSWWYVRVSDKYTSGSWEQFWTLVDKKTVGQFTDLKDKQGKEIYEGDLVNIEGDIRIIRWNNHLAQFALYEHDQTKQGTNKEWRYEDSLGGLYCEVIGNIYENPELLSAEVK